MGIHRDSSRPLGVDDLTISLDKENVATIVLGTAAVRYPSSCGRQKTSCTHSPPRCIAENKAVRESQGISGRLVIFIQDRIIGEAC